MSYNRWIGMGNLGRDPELRMTANGNAMLRFSLAITERWKDKQTGAPKEQTEWVNCTMFGLRAEGLSRHLSKGQKVLVEGKLQTREWEKDGQKHYSTEVKVDQIEFADAPRQGGQQRQQRPAPQQQRGFDLERDVAPKEEDPGDDFFRG